MQENDPLARGYNFDQIAIDSVREQYRRETFNELSTTLGKLNRQRIEPNQALTELLSGVSTVGVSISGTLNRIELSEPYDSFTRNDGVVIDSRILTASSDGMNAHGVFDTPFGYSRGGLAMSSMAVALGLGGSARGNEKVLLLTAMSEDQQIIGRENCAFGAVQARDGHTEYFRLGTIVEIDEADLPKKIQAMIEALRSYGQEDVANDMVVAIKLDPVQEQALIGEFQKATKVLEAKGELRRQELEATTRELAEKMGLTSEPETHYSPQCNDGRDYRSLFTKYRGDESKSRFVYDDIFDDPLPKISDLINSEDIPHIPLFYPKELKNHNEKLEQDIPKDNTEPELPPFED